METQPVEKEFPSFGPGVRNIKLPKPKSSPKAYVAFSLVFSDIAALSVSLLLAWQVRLHFLPLLSPLYTGEMTLDFFRHQCWILFILLTYLSFEGLYSVHLPFWRETRRLTRILTVAFLLILASISLGKMSAEFSRTVLVWCYFFALLLMPFSRLCIKTFLLRYGLWSRPVIILGAGKTGELVAQALIRDRYLGYNVYCLLDDDPLKKQSGLKVNGMQFQVLGNFQDCEAVMKLSGVRDLIVAAPGMKSEKLVKLVNRLQRTANSVLVVPDLFGIPVTGVKADYFFDEQMLTFRLENNLANFWNRLIKRTFDLTVGFLLFVCLLPVMTVIVITVKLDSPGPVFFGHQRIGQAGKKFLCYKFRTMVENAQEILKDVLQENPRLQTEWDQHYKLRNDPRITRVGKFFRWTSLDELPQLINVLKGEMSLVGPRPITKKEIPFFDSYIDDYYLVRPGITGLWQVSGRSEIEYRSRGRLEAWYIRNWSLWLDVTLLIRTLAAVLAGKGAY
ncbi:MAG: undecaprenyl-phosphate galactose phosphotransferase WbaP [Eubacteriales bacterium]|jgi:undecaprenyl-phosphate galactose phosphotransferase